MIPDWSERSADGAAYPHRHWMAVDHYEVPLMRQCPICCHWVYNSEMVLDSVIDNDICGLCFENSQITKSEERVA